MDYYNCNRAERYASVYNRTVKRREWLQYKYFEEYFLESDSIATYSILHLHNKVYKLNGVNTVGTININRITGCNRLHVNGEIIYLYEVEDLISLIKMK